MKLLVLQETDWMKLPTAGLRDITIKLKRTTEFTEDTENGLKQRVHDAMVSYYEHD